MRLARGWCGSLVARVGVEWVTRGAVGRRGCPRVVQARPLRSRGSASRGSVVGPGCRAGWRPRGSVVARRPRELGSRGSVVGPAAARVGVVQFSRGRVGRTVPRGSVAGQAAASVGVVELGCGRRAVRAPERGRGPGKLPDRIFAVTGPNPVPERGGNHPSRICADRQAGLRHDEAHRFGPPGASILNRSRLTPTARRRPDPARRGLLAARPHPETAKTRPAMPRGGSSKVSRNGFRLSKPARCTSRPAPGPAGPARPTPRGTPSAATAARREGARRAGRGTPRRRSRARRAR